jgi:hypothetical protein
MGQGNNHVQEKDEQQDVKAHINGWSMLIAYVLSLLL